MARQMTARYRGTCRGCGARIQPGDQILYGGRGNTTCLDCNGEARELTYKQRYGRCEDAPCCGCCGPYGDGGGQTHYERYGY